MNKSGLALPRGIEPLLHRESQEESTQAHNREHPPMSDHPIHAAFLEAEYSTLRVSMCQYVSASKKAV